MAPYPRAFVTFALAVSILTFPFAAVSAQARRQDLRNSSTLGFGYVVSVPNMYVGFAALGLSPKFFGGAGLYGDVKFTHDSPGGLPEYRAGISREQAELEYGDHLFEERSAWVAVNLALAYAITREFGLYAGGGYARERHYRLYFDESQSRGLEGFYWIPDDAASGNRVNALAGMLIRAGPHLVFQAGGETRPVGITVGVMLTLPF